MPELPKVKAIASFPAEHAVGRVDVVAVNALKTYEPPVSALGGPFKTASNLSDEEMATLHAAIVDTLREAVQRSAGLTTRALQTEKRSGLRIHGRAGESCPTCGDTVREVSFADSALQYCPTRQAGGKLLADRRLSHLLK